MRFTCPSCAKSYRLPPERLGAAGRAQISCPNCKALVLVRSVGGDVLDCKLVTNQDAAPSAAGAAPVVPSAHAGQPIWFVVVGRDKQGPMSALQLGDMLQAGTATAASLVWQKGMATWTKLHDVPELQGLLPATAPQPSAVIAQVPQPAAERVAHPVPMAARVSQGVAPQPPADPRVSQTVAPQPVAPQPVAPQPMQPRPQQPVQPQARATAPQPAPVPAQPRPVPAARQSQGVAQVQGQQQVQARTSQPVPKPAPRPAPRPADLDDAGPTMEADLSEMLKTSRPPVPEVKPNGKAHGKLERKDAKAIQADVHGASFFAAGHDLNDVELQLPDPNKHKPTKEEYNNLLQEFSVMFRLDKRSKRQKVLIAVIAATVVLGVITFGTLLYVNANKKRALIADSKAILAVFSLPYQTSVTVDIAKDEPPPVPGQPAVAAADQPKVEQQEVSDLSERLHKQIVKARKARPVQAAGGLHAMELTADQKRALAAATVKPHEMTADEKAALEAWQKRTGKGAEQGAGGSAASGEQVSQDQLRKWCSGQVPNLRGCTAAQGGGGFKVTFTVTEEGKLSNIKALEDGKVADDLTSCARGKLKANFGPQGGKTTPFTCSVD